MRRLVSDASDEHLHLRAHKLDVVPQPREQLRDHLAPRARRRRFEPGTEELGHVRAILDEQPQQPQRRRRVAVARLRLLQPEVLVVDPIGRAHVDVCVAAEAEVAQVELDRFAVEAHDTLARRQPDLMHDLLEAVLVDVRALAPHQREHKLRARRHLERVHASSAAHEHTSLHVAEVRDDRAQRLGGRMRLQPEVLINHIMRGEDLGDRLGLGRQQRKRAVGADRLLDVVPTEAVAPAGEHEPRAGVHRRRVCGLGKAAASKQLSVHKHTRYAERLRTGRVRTPTHGEAKGGGE